MGSTALPNLLLLLTVGSLLATAMPFDVDRDVKVPTSSRSPPCQQGAIADCISRTGLDGPACFAMVCAPEVDLKLMKREDTCTEENLIQCAVTEWRQAEICFQELCL